MSGVLGASEDGTRVYYDHAPAGSSVRRRHARPPVATGPAAAPPPTTRRPPAPPESPPTAPACSFSRDEPLTGYDNTDAATGDPDSEVFLYDAGGGLICLSCNPTNERPTGPRRFPARSPTERRLGSTDSYKPRASRATARIVFSSTPTDSLAALDTNGGSDVYQWEAQGDGTCHATGGCMSQA